jgi:hypothetical protein
MAGEGRGREQCIPLAECAGWPAGDTGRPSCRLCAGCRCSRGPYRDDRGRPAAGVRHEGRTPYSVLPSFRAKAIARRARSATAATASPVEGASVRHCSSSTRSWRRASACLLFGIRSRTVANASSTTRSKSASSCSGERRHIFPTGCFHLSPETDPFRRGSSAGPAAGVAGRFFRIVRRRVLVVVRPILDSVSRRHEITKGGGQFGVVEISTMPPLRQQVRRPGALAGLGGGGAVGKMRRRLARVWCAARPARLFTMPCHARLGRLAPCPGPTIRGGCRGRAVRRRGAFQGSRGGLCGGAGAC